MKNTKARAELLNSEFYSDVMNVIVPISVILPPNFSEENEPLPLLISLHGGGGSRVHLEENYELYCEMFADKTIQPMVVVGFSSGPASMYAGEWERFVSEELPDWMSTEYNTRQDRDGLLLTGHSMGGYGALKIAFNTPDRFCAVGVLEAAIEPALQRMPDHLRNTWYRMPATEKAVWGSPLNADGWLKDNPANIATKNAEAIRESGLEIYLEAGDEDYISLHDGAEFMHRVLWDNDIRHEYHLVRWADHVGASLFSRRKEMHTFLSAASEGGKSEKRNLQLTHEEKQYVGWIVNGGMAKGDPPPVDDPFSNLNRAASIHAELWRVFRETALQDPMMDRNYATLPPTNPLSK